MHNSYSSIRNGTSEVSMADSTKRDWRELCLEVTNERDSTKLTSLVQELIEALDKGERRWRHTSSAPDAIDTHQQESNVGTVCVSA